MSDSPLFVYDENRCVLKRVLTNKKHEDSDESTRFFVVELMGVEPMSERKSVRVSPGAACLLNFPWRGRIRTHYALVAS